MAVKAGKYLKRKRLRLEDYDYSQPGYYFVTIRAGNGVEVFGEVKNFEMKLNQFGKIAEKCWLDIPNHFLDVVLDHFVVMPNHVHGIIIIKENSPPSSVMAKNFWPLRWMGDVGGSVPWQTKLSRSLSSIVRGFKIGVTKGVHDVGESNFYWHRSFHDHVLRNEIELNNIRGYIKNNPRNWEIDRNSHDEDDYIFLNE
jgi:putative transposase